MSYHTSDPQSPVFPSVCITLLLFSWAESGPVDLARVVAGAAADAQAVCQLRDELLAGQHRQGNHRGLPAAARRRGLGIEERPDGPERPEEDCAANQVSRLGSHVSSSQFIHG